MNMDQNVKEYIDKLKMMLLKLNEITTFYGKVIDSNATFLHAHGIKASDEEVKTGHRLRDEFEQLKSEAMNMESVCDSTKVK